MYFCWRQIRIRVNLVHNATFNGHYVKIYIHVSSNIEHNLFFTTKCHDSSILITIIPWDYLNLSLADEYVDDVSFIYE
jgi:hypothetical protein